MGIFSRFSDIVNANMNSMLDKAEDPQKMIRMIIQEMEETLIEVRTSSARALADKKELQRRVESLEKQMTDWQEKASLALMKNREDLARAALIEKQKVGKSLEALNDEYRLVEEGLQKLHSDVLELENKLTEARTRQKALVVRQQTANNRREVRRQLDTGRFDKAMAKFEHFERRIDDTEAEVDSLQFGRGKSLESEFADLQAQDDIENELARLRSSLNDKH